MYLSLPLLSIFLPLPGQAIGPDLHRSVAEAISACFYGSVLRGPGVSSRVQRCLIAAVCSIWFLIAAVNQNSSPIDAAVFAARFGNPSDGLFVALVLWAVTSDWFGTFSALVGGLGVFIGGGVRAADAEYAAGCPNLRSLPEHVINSQWSSQQPLEGDASDERIR